MDSIIAGALQQQQAQTAMKVQMSIMQKTMEVNKEIGQAVIGLIESAAAPLQSPGKAIGAGANFDVYA